MDGERGSVLVTGGTRRIGAAICARLRADGWRVLVHARTAGEGVLAQELSEPMAAARLFSAAVAAAPDLRAIVNSAAEFSPAAELPAADEARLRRVNFEVPRALATLLAGFEDGVVRSVVNLTDASVVGRAPRTPYERTKADLAAWTRTAAGLFADTLRVNAVAPGPVLPPENAHVRGGETLLARRPTPEDVADAVAYLLDARSVTGVELPVDGGGWLIG